jgi:two-component system, HptB-dependent secretion and biofilm response regulator
MKVLVVDDQRSNRMVITLPLEQLGYDCIEAANGREAIDRFVEVDPDFVLMDVIMPVMDGYEAATEIKRLAGNRHVPIIFLTAKTETEDLLRCLECGGDDFLPKPVNSSMLHSKIKAHVRTVMLTDELRAATDELGLLHAKLKAEHEMGQHVLAHSMSRNWNDCSNVRSYLSAQSTFNGDLLLSAPKPYGGLYVLLGDLTGHGLGAALGSIPLSQMFFTMTAKGKSVAHIVREMNRSLRNFLPRSMFCAACVMELDSSGRHASLWLGGLPSCFHIAADGSVRAEISSVHVPLGILDPQDFKAELNEIALAEGESLLFMTDGLSESYNAGGEMFGDERVSAVLQASSGGNAFDNLLAARNQFVKGSAQDDDISLVEVLAHPPEGGMLSEAGNRVKLPWATEVTLNAEKLKALDDPVNLILGVMPESVEMAVHYDRVCTVFTELFSNALEHGLLELSSQFKSSAQGFAEYYQERATRLSRLEGASIDVRLSYDPMSQPSLLTICIKDSGQGFDLTSLSEVNQSQSHGRGLSLVRSLCSRLEFNDEGNEVSVDIALIQNWGESA